MNADALVDQQVAQAPQPIVAQAVHHAQAPPPDQQADGLAGPPAPIIPLGPPTFIPQAVNLVAQAPQLQPQVGLVGQPGVQPPQPAVVPQTAQPGLILHTVTQAPVAPVAVNPVVTAPTAQTQQMFFAAVNMSSEEQVLCLSPFTGGVDNDPVEYWRRFKNYLEFKQITNDADKLRLAKAMCIGEAGDWSDNLDSTARSNFQAFSQAFEKRWVKPSILRFRSARDMFSKKQEPKETVDSYASRTRKLGNKIDASDETMRYAFVSGLKPKIASFVLSKEPETMNQALDAARVAEMSIDERQEAENNELTTELAEMRATLKRMADRYDSLTPSAPLQKERVKSLTSNL